MKKSEPAPVKVLCRGCSGISDMRPINSDPGWEWTHECSDCGTKHFPDSVVVVSPRSE